MSDEKRPLRELVNAGNHILNLFVLMLILILLGYSSYSIWYTYSLTHGSFLSDELAMYRPDGYDPTLEDLMKINPDVRAWLTIDDTHIDYPVVQGIDNWEYLNRDVMGEFSLAGAIFLDSANTQDFTDPYNMIYGHHVEGGAMFSDVLEYRKASFFDSHRTGILWLPDKAYRLNVFACVEADAKDEVIYQDPNNVTADSLPYVVDNIISRAANAREMNTADKMNPVIGLSTCENAESFERVLIFAEMTPMSQSEMDAAMKKNKEHEPASAESNSPAKWYSPIMKHPWLFGSAGFLSILLILLLIMRSKIAKKSE